MDIETLTAKFIVFVAICGFVMGMLNGWKDNRPLDTKIVGAFVLGVSGMCIGIVVSSVIVGLFAGVWFLVTG